MPSIIARPNPRPNEEHKLEALHQALIAGEESGDAGELDMEAIRQNAKKKAGLALPTDSSDES